MSTRSSDSSSHSQDEDRRPPGAMIRGIGEYVKDPPPPPVISQFGGAFVEPQLPPPSTPQRKREFESSQYRASNYPSEEKRRRTRRSRSPSYSRSYESGRSSTSADAGDDLEEISEPKKIKEFRKLVEEQNKERQELEDKQQNELKTAITTSAQEIMHLESVIKKKEDKILDLKDVVDDLKDDLRNSKDDYKDKENELWEMKVVFEDTNKDYEKLKELYKKQEDDLQKSVTTIKRLEAEKLKLEVNIENARKLKDDAMKKEKESANQLDEFKKDVVNLQESLKKETADFNQTKVELAESRREAGVANEKLTNLEKELSEATKSAKESKEGLVKAEEENNKLFKENEDLRASLTLQTTENEMLKENLAKLAKANEELSIEATQGVRNIKAFYEGFKEKYEDEQSASKRNIEKWIRETKQRFNISDTDNDMLEEGRTTTHITTPKCDRSRQLPEEGGMIHIMKLIMESMSQNKPEISVNGKRETICPNATTTTEEIPLISSSTPHSSVGTGPRPSKVGNPVAMIAPSTHISQRDVSDKTVSSSGNIKTSPSQSTSRVQPPFRSQAIMAQHSDFFLPQSPIPQNVTQQTQCPWCNKEFPTMLMARKHVCENPRDPRMVKHHQKK